VVWLVVFALLRGGGDDCGVEPPETVLRAPPVPRKAGETGQARVGPPVRRARLGTTGQGATGALSGKTVYVSAGHGWTYLSGRWQTQRPNTHELVEDLVSAETVDQLLLDYLRLMGAHVVPLREADLNARMVVVDDDRVVVAGVTVSTGGPGFGAVELPIRSDDVQPFSSGGTLTMEASAEETGRATWSTELSEPGTYHVYVSYEQDPGRASDAHYLVTHAGGEAHFRVDQRRHGGTWVLLGRFHFQGPAAVTLLNDSLDAGSSLSIDAVRFGGGEGLFDRGGGALARPMAEHCARYYAQWNGAPPAVYTYAGIDRDDDVGARSRFAAWDHPDGEDAVYVSWHTNAPSPGTGTSSYTYSDSPPSAPLSAFSGVPGSLELQAAVHAEVVADLRAGWDPAWPDRGRFTAYFGELNPSHNAEMPAVLVEVAFHDTASDAAALKEPRFRRLAARAFAHGIARYFAGRDGLSLTLPPEPPTRPRLENDGGGSLRVSWAPPDPDPAGGDPPAGYRVYVSRDGHSFDEGTDVDTMSTRLVDLEEGALRFVRVAAVNAGGESVPTEVVGARLSPRGEARLLVVGGFDRVDAGLLPAEELPLLGRVERMWFDRMNDGSYAARHGIAIAEAGFAFDGAADEVIDWGELPLERYRAFAWFLGEESAGDEPLTLGQREAIDRLLAAGGGLFLSGSDPAWALHEEGSAAERSFFERTFQAGFAGDDAATHEVVPVAGPYQGLSPLSSADPSLYQAEAPDVLAPGAARVALQYANGTGAAAVIAASPSGGRAVLFGFPFETIEGAETRREVMAATLTVLELEPELGGIDGGCGCRTTRGRGPEGAWLFLFLLVRRYKRGSRDADPHRRVPAGRLRRG
jgi:N-acetylmuramoyl-L-alanine amidase